jgi:hypothetical protein
MNGEHAELFSYDLRLGLLADKQQRKELTPFDELGYTTVNSDREEPRAYLVRRRGDEAVALKVTSRYGKFELKVSSQQGGLFDQLKSVPGTFILEQDGSVTRTVEREKVGEALDDLVRMARSLSATADSQAVVNLEP